MLREPLLQFLVLGAVLFAVYGLVAKRSGETPEKIVVSASQITNLGDGFTQTWRRPPSKEELDGLIENYIRDEVFYRAQAGPPGLTAMMPSFGAACGRKWNC